MAVDEQNATPALDTDPGATPPESASEAPPEAQPADESQAGQVVQAATDDLADIEKPIEPRIWKFEGDFTLKQRGRDDIPQHFVGEYIQEPLSYLGFLEFTGLLARKIEESMQGPDGLTIKDVMDTAESAMPFVVDGANIEAVVEKRDFEGIDAFVQGLMKLASYVPDVIEECQFIWLRVPRRDRTFLREIWTRPIAQGGLSGDDGEEMLTLFLDQNYEELEAFFVERLPRIAKVAQAARKRMMKGRADQPDGSQRSRPWSRTAEPTPSQ